MNFKNDEFKTIDRVLFLKKKKPIKTIYFIKSVIERKTDGQFSLIKQYGSHFIVVLILAYTIKRVCLGFCHGGG